MEEVEFLEDEFETEDVSGNEIQSTSSKDSEDVIFVKMINKYGKPLLQKSQTPTAKAKKRQSMDQIVKHLSDAGLQYTESQIKKKMENMKTRLKKKIDSKKTGNVPIQLKPAEKILMDALDGTENPAISRLKCKCFCILQFSRKLQFKKTSFKKY